MSRRVFSIAAPAALLLVVLTGASAAGTQSAPAEAKTSVSAPVVGPDVRDALQNRYIVVLKNGTSDGAASAVRQLARTNGGHVHFDYGTALRGFAVTLPAVAVEALRNQPAVAFIEADAIVEANATQSPATWGLDRTDQRTLPLNTAYTYNATGSGVNAYVIDSGILTTHTDFGGRAIGAYSVISDGRGATDCNGHGTHVAGTLGSATYGIAKAVRLYAVRVLDCAGSGYTSGVIAGVDWVAKNHVKPAVANMSLGGGPSTALDTAVTNATNLGVSIAVAAGNESQNACNVSPARAAAAITVGSTTKTDARSWFSNFGSCLDLFAPGSSITSTWHTGTSATNTISGTSMASPHAAGVAALYLQGNPGAAPATVRDAMVSNATPHVITDAGSGSPNVLLYSLPSTTAPPAPPPAGCGLPETYTGSLSGTGQYAIHPRGTYFHTGTAGTHRGCLTGPSTADFDLKLYKWNGSSWTVVARGEGPTSTENVTYSGTAGYYYWRVTSYSGSGSYTFEMKRP